LRKEKVILRLPKKTVLDLSIGRDSWEGPLLIDVTYAKNDAESLFAENQLKNHLWLETASDIVGPLYIMEETVLKSEMVTFGFEGGRKLQNMLEQRLITHIAKRVDDQLQKSWIWDYVRLNLHVACATITLIGHAKPFDILKFCHGEHSCLLRDPTIGKVFFSFGDSISDLEGCYLYWDNIGRKFIRSGKVSGGKRGDNGGRIFKRRHSEHKEYSELRTYKESRFYSSYPSETIVSETSKPLGKFEILMQFVAFAIDRSRANSEIVKRICGDKEDILQWIQAILKTISKYGSIRGNDLEEVKLEPRVGVPA
jgi:hypothetical protein